MNVKSPYNFVPAPTEDEVYKPKWAEQVSHDIPFSDGESGEITLKITAETPIFIRNGHSKPSGSEQPTSEFSHVKIGEKKKYFIPATSIKGMLRNVLEIMSFSRMKQVDGRPFYGLRDMNNQEYKHETNQNLLRSGWLTKEAGGWVIHEVRHVRVRMTDIENELGIRRGDLENAENVIEKYRLIEENKNRQFRFGFEEQLLKHVNGRTINYGTLYRFVEKGDFIGNIVLFGNIDNKHYDFVFENEFGARHAVSSSLINNMEKLKDPLWNYHKESNRIPVFFKSESNKVLHFGFSKLYRLNNGNTIGSMKPLSGYESEKMDLSNLIFGNSNEGKLGLKGRVFISNAFCSNPSDTSFPQEIRVLSSPKPSYYPFYLKQKGESGILQGQYQTYIKNNSELAGYKRYPVHKQVKPNGVHENENIPSEFQPLSAGTVFYCKLRFHNLRKIEIGALISAITFHNNAGYFHTIGSAKPYGFGKISISLEGNTEKYLETLYDFESCMDIHVSTKINSTTKWIESKILKELFSMACNPEKDNLLVYPRLEMIENGARESNEFNNYKKASLFLRNYSIINGTPKIRAFISATERNRKLASFNLDSITSYSDIQNKIREDLNDNVDEKLHELIVEKIKWVYQNHKDSRKKMKKSYEEYFGKTPISKWIGEDRARELYSELNK